MEFTRHADGTVTVDEFDDEVTMSFELLRCADPKYLVVLLDVPYEITAVDETAQTMTLKRR